MRTFSSLLVLGAVLPLAAFAQSRPMEWPRTFSGQPDFDFERQEVLTERKRKAEEGENVAATPGTWEQVIKAPPPDPFSPRYPKQKKGKTVPGFAAENTGNDEDTPLLPQLQAFENQQLPQLDASRTVDLSEFKSFLERVIDEQVKNAAPRLEEVNVRAELDKIIVQTIATSPDRYVMINGRRYVVGDTLSLPIATVPPAEGIIAAVDSHLPAEETVGVETFSRYKTIRDEVVKEFTINRNANIKAYQTVHPLKILIKRIESRRLVVEILGQEHEISLRYAF
jgi:hypothetical protein